MTESRKQFEEWAATEGLKVDYSYTRGFYKAKATESAWQAWQASRAAIVVKLLSFFSDRYESEICFTDEVEKSLDEAGIRYD